MSYIQAVEKAQKRAEQDAQDAARYRWLRDAHWSEIEALYWHPDMQNTLGPEEARAVIDGLIDREIAAMKESTP